MRRSGSTGGQPKRGPKKTKRSAFSVCRILNDHPNRLTLVADRPNMTCAEAKKIADTYKKQHRPKLSKSTAVSSRKAPAQPAAAKQSPPTISSKPLEAELADAGHEARADDGATADRIVEIADRWTKEIEGWPENDQRNLFRRICDNLQLKADFISAGSRQYH